jgi:ATP-dependent helicase HrpB
MRSGLPIDEVLEPLRAALATQRNAVLVAPPGAGKSTVVPLALLDEGWARGARIVMLEPRRLAARAVAARMAATLGEAVGDTVGYRMRLETRVGRRTRIEVVTEGVFTRMLQGDPALGGVAAVLFDELHERNLNADVGLALALDAQRHVAPELRLLAMSATLDAAKVAALLGAAVRETATGPRDARAAATAPLIECTVRVHGVETRYVGKGVPALPGAGAEPVEAVIVRVAQRALRDSAGDVLVFLPGAAEIRRAETRLRDAELGSDVDVLPLYGELAAEAQDAAIAPARAGRRKIVLATNIAETSLTIRGVRIVIDSGLERRNVFDPASGMSRLETQRISRASAEQRAGRAGRTEPGICYRLWGESGDRMLAAHTPPEILTADLAPLALDLAVWGTDAAGLDWLDAPPAATLSAARDLLRRLGALDDAGRVTRHGRAMHALAAHPRLAHMLIAARERGSGVAAAELAALLSERDVLRSGRSRSPEPRSHVHERDSDIRTRLDILRRGRAAEDDSPLERATAGAKDRPSPGVDRGALERVRRAQRAYARQLGAGAEDAQTPLDPGVLLAFAYPDRIGRRRSGGDGRYQLASGRGASFAAAEPIAREELIVAVDLDDREREARILLAAPLRRADLLEHLGAQLVERDEVAWDARAEAVIARRTVRLGDLVIDEKPLVEPPPGAAAAALLEGLRSLGPEGLPWDDESRDFVARCEFARALERGSKPETDAEPAAPTVASEGAPGARTWPAMTEAALMGDLSWLEPFLAGCTRRAHFARVPLAAALRSRLTRAQLRELDELAPTHIELPTGTRARIDYRDDNAPCASMRMQEVFGLAATPRIGRGAVPITFKLLSPAQRPLQVTRDLASFWRNAYRDVRKDMRGRYPRHYWPENPLEAEPTRRAKPRPPRRS